MQLLTFHKNAPRPHDNLCYRARCAQGLSAPQSIAAPDGSVQPNIVIVGPLAKRSREFRKLHELGVESSVQGRPLRMQMLNMILSSSGSSQPPVSIPPFL
jgi:hypothetical protein